MKLNIIVAIIGLLVAIFAIAIIVIFANQTGTLWNNNSGTPARSSANTTPTPTSTQSSSNNPGEQTLEAYLVELDASAPESELIGCGDKLSAITQKRTSVTPLEDALRLLLSIDKELYADTGLYNSLWQSDLTLDSVAVDNGAATIALSGQLRLAGACDNPRVKEQLEATATQFSTVSSVTITLNEQSLEQALSAQ